MTLSRTGLAARHPLPLTPIGFRKDGRPIFPILGGAPDDGDDGDVDDTGTDDDGDVDDEPDEDDESDEDDEPDAKLGDAGKRALKAERDKNKALRAQIRELRNGKAKPDGKDDKGEPDPEAAAAAALELAKPVIIRSAAVAALKDAGLIGEPGRLVRLLDHKTIDVELDDNGEPDIDGLDDQIAELVEDYPQLFAKKNGKPGSINGSDRNRRDGGGAKPKSATERQAAGLLGRNR